MVFLLLDCKLGYIFKTSFFWFVKITCILALSSNFLKAFAICRISEHVLFHHPNYLWTCSSHPRQIIMENILSIWQWTTDTALWGQSIFRTLGHVPFFYIYICKESLVEGKECIIAPLLIWRGAQDDHEWSCKFCPVPVTDPIKPGTNLMDRPRQREWAQGSFLSFLWVLWDLNDQG